MNKKIESAGKYNIIIEENNIRKLENSDIIYNIRSMKMNARKHHQLAIEARIINADKTKGDIDYLKSLAPEQYLNNCDNTFRKLMEEFNNRGLPVSLIEIP